MNYIKHLSAIFERMDKDPRLSPFHIILYISLFRIWNLNFFKNPFSISRGEIMNMSKIGSFKTYTKCMKELHSWQYIRYEPSFDRHRGSKIYLYTYDVKSDKGSVIDVIPSINNINIVNNSNLGEQAKKTELDSALKNNDDMKSNEEEKEKLREKKKMSSDVRNETSPNVENSIKTVFVPPPLEHIKIYFDDKGFPSIEAEKFFNYFESNGWLVGGRAKMKDWKAAARNWMLNIPKYSSRSAPPKKESSANLNNRKNYNEPL